MTELHSVPGWVALFLMLRLIQNLVYRRTLTLADARETADSALLDAEQMLGESGVGTEVRGMLAACLADLDQTPDG